MHSMAPSLRNASLIRGLQYFEAVARHQSVKLAAAELGVSQNAVSHQLRQLTKELGEQLLVRSGRGIVLTPVGQRLAEKLSVTFTSLYSSVVDTVGSGRSTLRLAVCSSCAAGWVIPRLNSFFEQQPKTYSWWEYRQLAFRRNAGLRIDHILVPKPLAGSVRECRIDRAPRKREQPSDHAPVVADIALDSEGAPDGSAAKGRPGH